MKHLKEYEDKEIKGLMGDLEGVGLGNRPDGNVNQWNFFEKTQDFPVYSDVSGPDCEIAIDDLIQEYRERVMKIPAEDRQSAFKAMKMLWIEKITDADLQ